MPYRMSTKKFTDDIDHRDDQCDADQPRIIETFSAMRTANWPRPGQEKIVSVSTAPAQQTGKHETDDRDCRDERVAQAWRRTTWYSLTPLARAVRT